MKATAFLIGLLLAAPAAAASTAGQAREALLRGDYAGAAKLYSQAAESGDPEGNVGLGFLSHTGLGLPFDPPRAAAYFSKAAAAKYPKGLYYLGRTYKTGAAGRVDYARALELYTEAARKGYAPAYEAIGLLYARGQGVKKDVRKALDWLRRADKAGLSTAQNHMGHVYKDVLGDMKKAFACFKKAAESGDAQAATILGYMYNNGYGTEKNDDAALPLHKVSAGIGFSMGQYNYGASLFNKGGYAEAYKWLLLSELSDDQGNDNNGMAKAYENSFAARLTPRERQAARDAAAAEHPRYRAGMMSWSAERFCRDESPYLPTRK